MTGVPAGRSQRAPALRAQAQHLGRRDAGARADRAHVPYLQRLVVPRLVAQVEHAGRRGDAVIDDGLPVSRCSTSSLTPTQYRAFPASSGLVLAIPAQLDERRHRMNRGAGAPVQRQAAWPAAQTPRLVGGARIGPRDTGVIAVVSPSSAISECIAALKASPCICRPRLPRALHSVGGRLQRRRQGGLRILLGPSRMGVQELVARLAAGLRGAVDRERDRLGARRSDVHADDCVASRSTAPAPSVRRRLPSAHQARTCTSRRRMCLTSRRPGQSASEAGSPNHRGIACVVTCRARCSRSHSFSRAGRRRRRAEQQQLGQAHQSRHGRRDPRAPQRLPGAGHANGGNRFAGLPGHDASAQYVYDRARAAGYDVRFQEFEYEAAEDLSTLTKSRPPPVRTRALLRGLRRHGGPRGRRHRTDARRRPRSRRPAARPAAARPPTSPTSSPARSPSSSAARATSSSRSINAAAAGASAVIIFNEGNTPAGLRWTSIPAIAGTTIPVVATSFAVGFELRNGVTTVPPARGSSHGVLHRDAHDAQRDRRQQGRRHRQHRRRRRAPRQRPRGAGHQRQRLRLGDDPRDRRADGEGQAAQPGALHLVQRRGVRSHRLEVLRRQLVRAERAGSRRC